MTFSQRYNRTKPSLYECVYYLAGLQMFFIGLASALSAYILMLYAHLWLFDSIMIFKYYYDEVNYKNNIIHR